MAELTQQERLQPSLLDRLADDEPGSREESREKRALSLRKLRECVLRDLVWLLNAGNLASTQNLEDYPEVAHSVLNYGMPELTGRTASSVEIAELEQTLRQVIWDFEPRILHDTVRVRLGVDRESMSHNAMIFEIEGSLWAEPVPLQVFLKTELDLEIGDVKVSEQFSSSANS